jgi:BASS family bile acid:Na+ symporter
MTMQHIVGPVILFLLMTMVGLELRPADFRRVFKAPRAVVGGTIGQWLTLPLMTFALVEFMGLSPSFGAGAILLAVSPGAGMSNIAAAFARANVALSVTLTAMASVFAVLTLPLLSSIVMGLFLDEVSQVEVPVADLMLQLFVSLFLPIGLGMWLRTRNPERAEALAPRVQRIVFVAIGVAVVVGIVFSDGSQEDLFEGAGPAAVAAGIWTLLAAGLGWGIATLMRLPPDDRFTFVIEFAARNIAVTAIVAMSGLDRIDLTLFSGLYGAVGYPMVIAAVLLRRRLVKRREGD